ncbi:MAG TPA: DUF2147 domain-containing protein [Lentisphaeria bacterium]|nr:DUF2147 domain-containing protein [Lentisphaeria bacterium]
MTGKWKTFDDDGLHDGVIEIYQNDAKYFGKIVFLPKPEDKDAICDNCEGEDKDKPLLGLVILKNMKENKGEYSGGTILDPYSGKVYSCIIKLLENGNKLEVRGFCGISLFGCSKYWDRLKGNSQFTENNASNT